MLSFLRTVFGADITETEYHYANNVPYYIRDWYSPQLLEWGGKKSIILSPNDHSWRLPVLKKHLMKFQELCAEPCALGLENLTALQRRNLIENHIPFVSLSQQVYLPFWGCSFFEQFKAEMPIADKMPPGTQLVFLYLYYRQCTEPINLTQIAKGLSFSKATCTRAINDLTASGLVRQTTEGTKKWIELACGKTEFLKKGYARLKSPVERILHTKMPIQIEPEINSGMRALAQKSMIGADERDGAIAISKNAAAKIPADAICTQQYFGDFGGYVFEVWSYDPAILADGNCADDISLLLSMENDSNERVQMCLDEIRRRHGLPLKEEE